MASVTPRQNRDAIQVGDRVRYRSDSGYIDRFNRRGTLKEIIDRNDGYGGRYFMVLWDDGELMRHFRSYLIVED